MSGMILLMVYLVASNGGSGSTFTPPTSSAPATNEYHCLIFNAPSSANCSTYTNIHTIVINPAPQVVTPSQDVSICEGGTITPLYVQTPGLDPNISVTYEWFDITDPLNTFSVGSNATYPVNDGSPLSPVLSPGVYKYHCVLTFSSAGCSSQTSLPITITIVDDPTVVSISNSPQDICEGGVIDPDFDLTVSGGLGNITYAWYDNNNPSSVLSTNPTFNPGVLSNAGVYEYYVVIDDIGNGCDAATSSLFTVNVSLDPTSDTILFTQTVCEQTPSSATTLAVLNASGGINSTYSYEWYDITNGLPG